MWAKEELLSWFREKILQQLWIGYFLSQFRLKKNFHISNKYWKKYINWGISNYRIVPIIFEYDPSLEEFWDHKYKFVFIDHTDLENKINCLNKQKTYCLFGNSKNSDLYHQCLINKGYKIIRVSL